MNAPLLAEQLVYTNVKADYSPAGSGGYQTVCASAGLSTADRTAIEKLIDSLPDVPVGVERWQYFQLPDGRPVITLSQYFAPDGEISDPRGAFLAHALVLAKEDFERLDCHPLRVIDGSLFIQSARDMVGRFGPRTATIPQVEVSVTQTTATCEGWTGPELQALLGQTLAAEGKEPPWRRLLIQGTSKQVVEVIRLAVDLMPSATRWHCWFDTLADPRTTPPGLFWALGTTSSMRDNRSVLVDAAKQKVTESIPLPATFKSSIYGTWLLEQMQGDVPALAEVLPSLPGIQVAARVLGGTLTVPATGLEVAPEAWARLTTIAAKNVRHRFLEQLAACTSPKLAEELVEWLWGDDPEGAEAVRTAVSLLGDPRALCQKLFEWVIESELQVESAVWKNLLEAAEQSEHDGLVFLARVGLKAKPAMLDDALARVSPEEYAWILTLSPKLLPPKRVLTPARPEQFLQWLAGQDVSDRAIIDCVTDLVKKGCAGPFKPLRARIEGFSEGDLERLPEILWSSDPKFAARMGVGARDKPSRWQSLKARLPWPFKH